MSRNTPTPQQNAVVKALNEYNELKVEACAGSGKTSTLVLCAEANEVPSLYLAFNKSAATDAAKKFPKHVTCQTTHSRAYAVFGTKLRDKLNRPRGAYVNVAGTGSEIARFYKVDTIEVEQGLFVSSGFMGLLARDTVARFEQSADAEVLIDHVPTQILREKLHDNVDHIKRIKKVVFKIAQKLWEDRIDLKSPVLATHDTYLKLFQLSKPVFGGFDILYVDEFQDTTPCVLDIVKNQMGRMKVVMVGDARQAIYGWRGAVNAMQMVNCASRSLTKSFRYGPAIADIATSVLERDMVIAGNENIASVAGLQNMVDRSKPYTRLFRTNAALLEAAVEEIVRGTAVSLEIDVKDFVKLLQSADALYTGDKRNVKHDKIIPYDTWGEIQEEAKHEPDLGRVVKAVNDGNATRWCHILENHVNAQEPHVTFTTSHKAKGREWRQVIVENDFKSCYDDDGEWRGLSVEEQNLLYVALTRAVEVLEYNNTVSEYLNWDKAESCADTGGSIAQWSNINLGIVRGEMAQYALMQEEGRLYE